VRMSSSSTSYGIGGIEAKMLHSRQQNTNDRAKILDKLISFIDQHDYESLQGSLSGGIDISEWNQLLGASSLHDEASRLELARILLPRLYTADSENIVLAGLSQDEQNAFNEIYANQCATRKQYFQTFLEKVDDFVFDLDKMRFLREYYGSGSSGANSSAMCTSDEVSQDYSSHSSGSGSSPPFIAISCKDFITLLRKFTFSHDKIDVTQFMLPKIIDLKLRSDWILWEFQFAEDRMCVNDMIENVLIQGLDEYA